MTAMPYTSFFYSENRITSRRSAEKVVPLLIDLLGPRSVVDVGCGVGTWLSIFIKHGVEDVLGIDGDYVNREMLQIPSHRFVAHDISKQPPTQRQFDLVISLEVAEHLKPKYADNFVKTLTSLGPVVVFSAAIPRQSGQNHYNEQWLEYWIKIFSAREYMVIDCLRPRIWNDTEVEYWYAQNMFLFVNKRKLNQYPRLKNEIESMPYARIHPRAWLWATDPHNMDFRKIIIGLPFSLWNGIKRRLQGLMTNLKLLGRRHD